MKSLKSLPKLSKPKLRQPILVRRVVGFSMVPVLLPGTLVWARGVFWRLKRGNIVIVLHEGREKIKRIAEVDGQHVYVLGDNPARSTDSREFGWLPRSQVIGKVITRR